MQVSIEISLYPLAEEEFKTEIWIFINRLREIDGLKVVTNGMSTQIFGEYDFTVEDMNTHVEEWASSGFLNIILHKLKNIF